MRRRTVLATVFAVVATVAGALGIAQARGWGRPDPDKIEQFARARIERVLDELEARPEQRAAITAIADKLIADAKPILLAKRDTHEAVLKLFEGDKVDAAALHALIDERGDEMKGLAHAAADAAVQVHGVLDPAQRAELLQHVRERAGRHGPWGHPGK